MVIVMYIMMLPQMLSNETFRNELNATSEAMYGQSLDEMLEEAYGMDLDELFGID